MPGKIFKEQQWAPKKTPIAGIFSNNNQQRNYNVKNSDSEKVWKKEIGPIKG